MQRAALSASKSPELGHCGEKHADHPWKPLTGTSADQWRPRPWFPRPRGGGPAGRPSADVAHRVERRLQGPPAARLQASIYAWAVFEGLSEIVRPHVGDADADPAPDQRK
jgi:hypothetical protein